MNDFEELSKYRISRAFETIKEAEAMISNKFWNASVNRIYYSCFYAVSGLLLTKNISPSTHKGVRQMFGLHFVQNGVVSKEMAKYYNDLFDRRQSGDYDDFILFNEETSEKLLKKAKEFVSMIDSIIKNENQT